MSEVCIDVLNDDCLLQILELLVLKDRVIVERVSKRWHRLCRQLWRSTKTLYVGGCVPQYYSFGFGNKNTDVLEPLLRLCGRNLRSLAISDQFENNIVDLIELITEYCDSLESFTLDGWNITDPEIEKFYLKLHSLTKTKLNCVTITENQLEHIFTSQPKLMYLKLLGIYTLNNLNFDKLNKDVVSISIIYCRPLNNDFIISLNKFKHLKKLQIYTEETLNLNELCREIPQIEYLTIESYECEDGELCEIFVLKNLRSLNLNLPVSISDNTMTDMVKNLPLLEDIEFGNYVDYSFVTNEGLHRLKKMPKLKRIKISDIVNWARIVQ